ncbi:hypothetical protein [Streptomyces venezuelae]|uniref:hypothetical protein n=1 Tax=Streptomyces venezuelae TaxID=54571 RepID=UPI0037A43017
MIGDVLELEPGDVRALRRSAAEGGRDLAPRRVAGGDLAVGDVDRVVAVERRPVGGRAVAGASRDGGHGRAEEKE